MVTRCTPPERSNYFRDPEILKFWETPSKVLMHPGDYTKLIIKNEIRGADNVEKKTIIKFYSPILKQNPEQEIHYDYRRLGSPDCLNNQELCHYI